MQSWVQISSTQASGLVCLHMPVISALGIGAGKDRQKGCVQPTKQWQQWWASSLARESQGVRQRTTEEDTWYCLVSTQAHKWASPPHLPPPLRLHQQQQNHRGLMLIFFLKFQWSHFHLFVSFRVGGGGGKKERKKKGLKWKKGLYIPKSLWNCLFCWTFWLLL